MKRNIVKILFFVENAENETAKNLISSFGNHPVDIIPYYKGGINQCEVVERDGQQGVLFSEHFYRPSDYAAALLWCWGTADLGRKYLRIFEEQGVEVLNSTHHTEVTDSKIDFFRLLQKADIPSPKTIFLDDCLSLHADSSDEVPDLLGPPPYVLKSNYGTRGEGIQFLRTLSDTQRAFNKLIEKGCSGGDFLLQEFIGNPEAAIHHYRVIVIGDQVLSQAIKATAKKPMSISNISAGSAVEWVDLDEDLKSVALDATRASGLTVAGVDIMVAPDRLDSPVLVLEVNDGPGTKTFDRAGFQLSQQIVDYFISRIKNNNAVNDENYHVA